MQTLEKPGGAPPDMVRRTRRRGSRLKAAAAGLVGVAAIAAFHAAGALVVIGACGVGSALWLRPRVRRSLETSQPRYAPLLFFAWLGVTLALGTSFAVSGAAHAFSGAMGAEVAAVELKRTALAAALFGVWWAGARAAGRKRVGFIILFTAAILEAGRLLAFGLRPGPMSHAIWLATALGALASRTWRSQSRGRFRASRTRDL